MKPRLVTAEQIDFATNDRVRQVPEPPDWLDAGPKPWQQDVDHRSAAVEHIAFARERTTGQSSPAAPAITLLTVAQLEALPKATGIVDGIIPGGIVCIAGAPGTGKSTLAAALAVARASGSPFLRTHPVTEPGSVIWVAGEAAENLPRSLPAACVAHGLAADAALPIWIIAQSFSLFSAGREHAELVEMAASMDGTPTWIWDTLGIFSAGAKENANDDMQIVMSNMRRIRGNHVVLHHLDKGERDARGAGSIKANCDALLTLIATDDRLTLSCAKMRAAAPFPDLHLRLVPVPDCGAAAIRPARDVVHDPRTLSPNQRAVLDALWASFGASGATTPQLESACPTVKQRTLYAAVERLASLGYVRREAGRVWPERQP